MRKGVATLPVAIALILAIIVSVVAFRATTPPMTQTGDIDEVEQPTEPPTTGNTPQITPNEFNVTGIIVDQQLVPSGVPVDIMVQLEKVSGQDPYEVTLNCMASFMTLLAFTVNIISKLLPALII